MLLSSEESIYIELGIPGTTLTQARIQGGGRRARAPPPPPKKKEGRKGKERKEKEKGKEKERHLDVIISAFVPI